MPKICLKAIADIFFPNVWFNIKWGQGHEGKRLLKFLAGGHPVEMAIFDILGMGGNLVIYGT